MVLDTVQGAIMVSFADNSWVTKENGRSTTGYVIYVYGAHVMWKTQKQSLVSVSSCEAEYAALSDCVLSIEWMTALLNDLKLTYTLPVCVSCDSSAAESLAKDQSVRSRSKRITIRYENVSAVAGKLVNIQHCESSNVIADLFTKVQSAGRFVKCRKMLQLQKSERHVDVNTS